MEKTINIPRGRIFVIYEETALDEYFLKGGGEFPLVEISWDDHDTCSSYIGTVTTSADCEGYEIDWDGGADEYPENWEDITHAVKQFLNEKEVAVRYPEKQVEMKRHIEALQDIIETMPDKKDSGEGTQKNYLLHHLKAFEKTVNGIVPEDWE